MNFTFGRSYPCSSWHIRSRTTNKGRRSFSRWTQTSWPKRILLWSNSGKHQQFHIISSRMGAILKTNTLSIFKTKQLRFLRKYRRIQNAYKVDRGRFKEKQYNADGFHSKSWKHIFILWNIDYFFEVKNISQWYEIMFTFQILCTVTARVDDIGNVTKPLASEPKFCGVDVSTFMRNQSQSLSDVGILIRGSGFDPNCV